ncbi:RNA polymerase sigma factor [Bacteriovorax sp. DB6_IX]|uniref:RNA polymerase sigma factor n=1 Tax=Bacteriovorax sp. DB6_IX TaxID=1353530 RepID=UPI0009DB97C0|nr:RNA polymerase sigma factor [Bacteriovorax sp. DB6_IX]
MKFFEKLLSQRSVYQVYEGMENEELMLLVQSGDIKAFEFLYERLKVSLYNYIRHCGVSEQQGIELVQDVMFKAYEKRMLYRSEYKLTTWIWTIARNQTIDLLRKRDPLKFAETEEVEISSGESEMEVLIDDKIERAVLEKCFKNLLPQYSEALSLRVYSEMSYEEIAEVMNKSLSSVKALINKAKKALRDCVNECMGEANGSK